MKVATAPINGNSRSVRDIRPWNSKLIASFTL
jgi:hypothetical protein